MVSQIPPHQSIGVDVICLETSRLLESGFPDRKKICAGGESLQRMRQSGEDEAGRVVHTIYEPKRASSVIWNVWTCKGHQVGLVLKLIQDLSQRLRREDDISAAED